MDVINTFLGKAERDMESADPMKEDLFQMCMKEIDNYLNKTTGIDEMQWIASNTSRTYTSENLPLTS